MEVLEMDGSTAGAGKDAIPRRTADGSQVLQLVREILEENERLKAQVESSEAIQRECNELRTALDDAVRILVNVRDTLERHQAEARRSGSGRSEERQNASVLTTRKS
jgi:hypothetical protein